MLRSIKLRDNITNELAVKFFINRTPFVIEACEPLKEIGVQFFSYSQISKENRLLYLSNNEEYTQHKFAQKVFGGYDYVHNARQDGVKVVLLLTPNENSQTDSRRALSSLGYNVGIDFYTEYNESIETFHFAGSDASNVLIECCKNHQWVFRRFIQFFKNQLNQTIYNETTPRYILGVEERSIEAVYHSQTSQNLGNILKRLNEKMQFHNVYLSLAEISTSKEYDILEMLVEGYQIKEIAIKLKMSSRTVEDYAHRLKIKVGIQTVRELYKQDHFLF